MPEQMLAQIDFRDYLERLIGGKEARGLMDALREGRTILVTGTPGPTGKTTLTKILRRHGYRAAEEHQTYEVRLDEPLETMVPCMDERVFMRAPGRQEPLDANRLAALLEQARSLGSPGWEPQVFRVGLYQGYELKHKYSAPPLGNGIVIFLPDDPLR